MVHSVALLCLEILESFVWSSVGEAGCSCGSQIPVAVILNLNNCVSAKAWSGWCLVHCMGHNSISAFTHSMPVHLSLSLCLPPPLSFCLSLTPSLSFQTHPQGKWRTLTQYLKWHPGGIYNSLVSSPTPHYQARLDYRNYCYCAV